MARCINCERVYQRQDDWQGLCRPCATNLRQSLAEFYDNGAIRYCIPPKKRKKIVAICLEALCGPDKYLAEAAEMWIVDNRQSRYSPVGYMASVGECVCGAEIGCELAGERECYRIYRRE